MADITRELERMTARQTGKETKDTSRSAEGRKTRGNGKLSVNGSDMECAAF